MNEEIKVEKKAMSEEFQDKPSKVKLGFRIVSKTFNIVITLVVIAWAGILLYDYFQVSNEKEPKFCLEENIIEYDDGITKECKGIGYKIYKYERESFNGLDFGPFWIKERTTANK